ncbi:hypothetical protein, partial [Curtobacterium sp. VKM Ac-1376]|uniref:hypothetical protein n=1 Tax=Curtobacterium sp. VKM Ac-1376 TaxID=123312 RepID=UPI001E4F0148
MTTTEAGTTPRPRGIATRAKILSVAERLFTERGFEGTLGFSWSLQHHRESECCRWGRGWNTV